MPAPTSTHSPSNESRRAPPYSSSQSALSLVADWLPLGLGLLVQRATPLRPPLPTLTCCTPSSTSWPGMGLKLITVQGLSDPIVSCSCYLPADMSFPLIPKQCQLLAQCHSLQFLTCPNTQQFENPCRWTCQHYTAFHFCKLLSIDNTVIHPPSVTHSGLTISHLGLCPQTPNMSSPPLSQAVTVVPISEKISQTSPPPFLSSHRNLCPYNRPISCHGWTIYICIKTILH